MATNDLIDFLVESADKMGVPPDLALSLAHAESSLNPKAVGPVTKSGERAVGLFQLMPGTAKELGVNRDDPYENILGGLAYLKQNYDTFGDWSLAVAAHQAGPDAVKRAGGIPRGGDGLSTTQQYVDKIMGGVGRDYQSRSDQPQAESRRERDRLSAQQEWADALSTDFGSVSAPRPVETKSSDGALSRGIAGAKSSASQTAALARGDFEGAARSVAEQQAYRQANPESAEEQKFMDDYRNASGIIESLGAVAKNPLGFAKANVAQLPNMVAPMAGMIGLGAAGSAAGPVGTVAGGFTGATLGNALVEGGQKIEQALTAAGINPSDTASVTAFLRENQGDILTKTGIKAGVIGAVDTATMGIAVAWLKAPARAAAQANERLLTGMGVNLADKVAVQSAMRSPTYIAGREAIDGAYKAATTGSTNFFRNAGVAALEPASEFSGEYFGEGLSTGDYNAGEAGLEALMAMGSSSATFAGQKAYQLATQQKLDAVQQTTPAAPPTPTPADILTAPDVDTAISTFNASGAAPIDTNALLASIEQQVGSVTEPDAVQEEVPVVPAEVPAPQLTYGQQPTTTAPIEQQFTALPIPPEVQQRVAKKTDAELRLLAKANPDPVIQEAVKVEQQSRVQPIEDQVYSQAFDKVNSLIENLRQGYAQGSRQLDETGQDTTLRKVRKHAIDQFTAITGDNKKAKRITDFLLEDGNITSELGWLGSEDIDDAIRGLSDKHLAAINAYVAKTETATVNAETKPKATTQQSIVKRDTSGLAARDGLVGAIMRVTGNKGIDAGMAQTITGDKAGSGNPKLRGLFLNGGTMDLGDVAELLRVQENFDVRDGDHLSELIRNAAAGDVATSMERTESDAAAAEEAKRKDYYLKRAGELGLKGVGGRRKLEHVVAQVDAKEAEIATEQKRLSELEAAAERQAIQAADILEDGEVSEAEFMRLLSQTVDYTEDEINAAVIRSQERTDRQAEAVASLAAEEQAQGSVSEGNENSTATPEGSATEGGESGSAEELTLTGETNEEAAANAARKVDPNALTKEEISAQSAGFGLQQQDGAPKPAPVQDGLRFSRAAGKSNRQFVTSPDGSLDFGEITEAQSSVMRRQPGKIRLTIGIQNADGTGHGLVHIEANHGKQIRNAGFGSVEEFVSHVASDFGQVWGMPGVQLLATVRDGKQHMMYVELEQAVDKDGEYYRVNSAFPVRQEDYPERHGFKKLWDGSEPTPAVTGKQSAFAGQSESGSGQTTPNARSQSNSNIQPDGSIRKSQGESTATTITEQQATTAITDKLGNAGKVLVDAGQIILVRTEEGLRNLPGAVAWSKKPSNTDGMAGKDTVAGTQAPTSAGDGSNGGATIEVDGVLRSMLNSKGNQIHPTQEGIRNFWRWFGDSKVVDSEGRPLVLYHGTTSEIDAFSKEKLGSSTKAASAKKGFFFTTSPKVATSYALAYDAAEDSKKEQEKIYASMKAKKRLDAAERELEDYGWGDYIIANKDERKEIDKELVDRPKARAAAAEFLLAEAQSLAAEIEDGGNILPVYLRIISPLEHDHEGSHYRDQTYAKTLSIASSNGHDGAVIKNTFDAISPRYSEEMDVFVVFDPSQIKSAIGNTGSFGNNNTPNEPSASAGSDVRYSTDGAIQGATLPDGRIALVLDNLTQDNIGGVLKHEGFHSSIKQLLGEKTYAQLMNRLGELAKVNKSWAAQAEKSIPADTKAENWNEEIGAYAIEQYERGDTQPGSIRKWVESFLSAIRTAIIKSKWMPERMKLMAMKNLKPQDLARLAVAGLQAKANGIEQAQGREAMAYSQSIQTLANAWMQLAKDKSIFKYPVSDSKDIVQVFKEVAPNLEMRQYGSDFELENSWDIFPDGNDSKKVGHVLLYKDGHVELNMLHFGEGNGGYAAYSAVGNWAFNTGHKFAADRFGVDGAGISRRIENVIALALKFGSTDFMTLGPAVEKRIGGKLKDGAFETNLNMLLQESYDNVAINFPEIENVQYNFESGRFEPDVDAGLIERARAAGVQGGKTTLERAALSGTILVSRGLPEGWGTGSESVRQKGGKGPQAVLYSRAAELAQTATAAFKKWFGDSKVVTDDGKPLAMYHGTGNLENLSAFDPSLTGKGNDQIGSGFYFTTEPEEASGYATSLTQQARQDSTKIGGDSSPGVAKVWLSIKKPIEIKGSNLVDSDVSLTHKQALEIIKRAPGIRDLDESPLGDHVDIWSAGKVTDKMISDVAKLYTGHSLISLEGDMFRNGSDAYRKALHDVLGYDGVVKDFGNGHKHYVAWFPEQIKSATGNNGNFDSTNPDIRFSRASTQPAALPEETKARQRNLDALNSAIKDGEGIDNAFGLAAGNEDLIAAFDKTFGVEVVAVTANNPEAANFLGLNYKGTLYVNAENQHAGFVQIAGHELLHQIARDQPSIYSYFETQARNYLKDGAIESHTARLIAAGESADVDTYQEILADFVGDALADKAFLQTLAEANQSKFRMFINYVNRWLNNVMNKMRGAGLQSSEHFTDVSELREYLAAVLDVYSDTKTIPASDGYLSRRVVAQAQQAPLPEETKAEAAQRKVQDKFNRFTAAKEWAKDNGLTLSPQADVYRAEERYHGRVATRIEDFREKTVNPLIQKIQKAGFTMQDVADFLEAQHTAEANAQIQKISGDATSTAAGITDKEAADYLSKAKPELAAVANEFRDITNKTRDLLLKNGIITQEMADAWEATYQHYVPLKGGPDEVAQRTGSGPGMSVNGKQKRRLGHGKRDEHVIENIMRDYERAVVATEKNLVGQHMLKMALEVSALDPDLITIGKPERRKVLMPGKASYVVEYHGSVIESFDNRNDANRFVQQMGKSGMKVVKSVGDPHVQMIATPMLQENEATVYVNGSAVRVQINDPILAQQYKNLGVEQLNVVLSAARGLNNWLAKAYTGYNPEFILVNMARDFTGGMINLTGTYGMGMASKALANYPKAFKEVLRYAITGNASADVQQYRDNGGSTGSAYLGDIERVGKDIEAEYNEYVGIAENLKQGKKWNATRAAGRKLFINGLLKWVSHLNAASENAMRVATFVAVRDKTGDIAEAASAAKGVTVNFNRKGEAGSTIGALYLFANPNIQGTAALYKALFRGEYKSQAWALVGGMMTLAAMMAMQFDDDEWEKIPEYEKDRNLLIRVGDKRIKIPVPYGYGFFFGLGNVYKNISAGDSPMKVSTHLASSFFEHFSPLGNPIQSPITMLPTALKIPMEPALNINDFGRKIVPGNPFTENKPDFLKMSRTTKGGMADSIARGASDLTGGTKATAGAVDVSPETLKYWWKTMTGGTGAFFTDVARFGGLVADGAAPDLHEIPLVRKFASEGRISDSRAVYYKKVDEAKQAWDAFNTAQKEHDLAGMDKLRGEKELFALAKASDRARKAVKSLRDREDAILQDDSKTLAERRLQVKLLERKEEELYGRILNK